MNDFITALTNEFEANRNAVVAAKQKAYLKNKFECYGMPAPIRREITRPFLNKNFIPSKAEAFEIIKELWQLPQREFQYFSMDLMLKYSKQLKETDIDFFEHLITEKSWWDTVDFLAVNMVGNYMDLYPDMKYEYAQKWLDSQNMWLQRTAVLFQLKYKEKTDLKLLSHCINALLGSKEFFINKAIGWALRQYSGTDPAWVTKFVAQTDLNSLSKREALRKIL